MSSDFKNITAKDMRQLADAVSAISLEYVLGQIQHAAADGNCIVEFDLAISGEHRRELAARGFVVTFHIPSKFWRVEW